MVNHRIQTKKSMGMGPILALVCFTFGLVNPAAAACTLYTLETPFLDTLKLADGENRVIASVKTKKDGNFEARVNVKDKVISDPFYFIRGTRMTEIAESKVPKDISACLNLKTSGLFSSSWYATAAVSALDWIVPAAEARTRRVRYIVTVSCNSTVCCALAKGSDGSRGVGCSAIP